MSSYSTESLFLFVLIIVIGCEGKHVPEKPLVEVNQAQTVMQFTESLAISVDIMKSTIRWRGTKMRGLRGHEGTIKLKEGKLFFKDDTLVGGFIVVDMDGIGITDIPAHESVPIRNLTNHLKSEFNTKGYPTSRFEITKVVYLTPDSLKVWGNMTIKDVTKSIAIPVQFSSSDGFRKVFTTEFKLNRFAWHIGDDGSWLEKRVVDPDFELRIRIFPKYDSPLKTNQ